MNAHAITPDQIAAIVREVLRRIQADLRPLRALPPRPRQAPALPLAKAPATGPSTAAGALGWRKNSLRQRAWQRSRLAQRPSISATMPSSPPPAATRPGPPDGRSCGARKGHKRRREPLLRAVRSLSRRPNVRAIRPPEWRGWYACSPGHSSFRPRGLLTSSPASASTWRVTVAGGSSSPVALMSPWPWLIAPLAFGP